jgi:hypothetical protein
LERSSAEAGWSDASSRVDPVVCEDASRALAADEREERLRQRAGARFGLRLRERPDARWRNRRSDEERSPLNDDLSSSHGVAMAMGDFPLALFAAVHLRCP